MALFSRNVHKAQVVMLIGGGIMRRHSSEGTRGCVCLPPGIGGTQRSRDSQRVVCGACEGQRGGWGWGAAVLISISSTWYGFDAVA